MPRIIPAFFQFFDGDGAPLDNGWLHFLAPNTNDTNKATYADAGQTIPNTNPVQLDAEGRCPNIFGSGSYRVVSYTNDPVMDAPAVQIQQFDPVPGGVESAGQFVAWLDTVPYDEGSIVVGSDGKYYVSLETDNDGNDPTSTVGWWREIKFIKVYTAEAGTEEGDVILFTDGSLYYCREDVAAGVTPVTDPVKFKPAVSVAYAVQEKVNALGVLTGGTSDINLFAGDVVTATISTAEQTFTFSNKPPTGSEFKFEMRLTNGGSQAVNLPAGWRTPGGEALIFTESGEDRLVFSTIDGFVTYDIFKSADIKAPA